MNCKNCEHHELLGHWGRYPFACTLADFRKIILWEDNDWCPLKNNKRRVNKGEKMLSKARKKTAEAIKRAKKRKEKITVEMPRKKDTIVEIDRVWEYGGKIFRIVKQQLTKKREDEEYEYKREKLERLARHFGISLHRDFCYHDRREDAMIDALQRIAQDWDFVKEIMEDW